MRRGRVQITVELLKQVFPFPGDTHVVSVEFNAERRTLELECDSDAFPETPEGQPSPVVTLDGDSTAEAVEIVRAALCATEACNTDLQMAWMDRAEDLLARIDGRHS